MPYRIVAVVEGQGEVAALPALLRRVLAQLNPPTEIEIARPIRQPRGTLLKDGGIEAAVGLAAIAMGASGTVLLLLDSEGDCPAEMAALLLRRAQGVRRDKRISVVLAHHEFEAWFLASAASFRGIRGFSEAITDHHDPESVSGCKEWLEAWLPPTSKYSETTDQVALAAVFNMAAARERAPSFDKFWREIEIICTHAVLTQ